MKTVLTAEVAVPIPIDGTLTYLVPDGLTPPIEIGARVLVPVRKKVLTGVVWMLESKPSRPARLRAIRQVIDAGPVLTADLLSLAEWISEYYVAPIGEVLASMAPPRAKLRRVYRLQKAPDGLALEIMRTTHPEKAMIIEMLAAGKHLGLETIKRRIPGSDVKQQLDALEKEGHIVHEVVAAKRRSVSAGTAREAPNLPSGSSQGHRLTSHQQEAFNGIRTHMDAGRFKAFLLLGVTGSGKTEVYLRCIEHALKKGQKAIYLVPEIGLTPQIMRRVEQRFGSRAAVLHSRLSHSERHRTWQAIMSGSVDVVVGARSAVFAPVPDLGIVIVDEEHDTSYKQQDSPRYNAREIATERARRAGAVVVLGSATPTIETYQRAVDGAYGLFELPERISGGDLPDVSVVDMRAAKGGLPISDEAERSIAESIANQEQVLLFLNRRGFSNYVQCRDCGFVPRCRNCNVTLTYHIGRRDLRCHYCGYAEQGWTKCPRCAGANIEYVGSGTQKIEDFLTARFPQVPCARFDRDATRKKGSAEALLTDFTNGLVSFLVGTQMIAKGHDFKRVGLVVVVNADVSMNLPDFRSGERTFQILTQVAGRAGRGEIPGRVLIQTYNPDHHCLTHVACHDFKGFYRDEVDFRRELRYPPFGRLIRVVAESKQQASAQAAAREFAAAAEDLRKQLRTALDVVGPSRTPISKVRNVYRWHIILKGDRDEQLSPFIRRCVERVKASGVCDAARFSIDVDPQMMM